MKKLIRISLIASLVVLAACTGKAPADNASSLIKNKEVFKQITLEILRGLKDAELEQAIFDNVKWTLDSDPRDLGKKVADLSAGQRAIYITWIMEEEVRLGGLKQFYTHYGKSLADFTPEAFETIGAHQYAEVFKEANVVNNSIKDQNLKPVDDPFEKQEDKYEELRDKESLDQLKVMYIRDNPDEFVSRTSR